MPEKVYFGSLRQAGWVKAPNPGVGASSEGSSDLMEFANGGAFVSQSGSVHRTYDMAWDIGDEADFQFLRDYRSGELGTGLMYWVDPMIMRKNALPPHVARPELSTRGWPSTVGAGIEPERVAAGATLTNLATNPSFETASGVVATLTNLFNNPSGRRTLTGYTGAPGTLVLEAPSLTRIDINAAAASNSAYIIVESMTIGGGKLLASTQYTFSASIYGDFTSVGVFVGGAVTGGASTTIAAGAFIRSSTTFTTTATGSVVFYVLNRSAAAVGNKIAFRDAQVELGAVATSYLDGNTAATGDFTYAWTGTADASASEQQAVGVGSGFRVTAIQSSEWFLSGRKSVRLIVAPNTTNPDTYYSPLGDGGAIRGGLIAGGTFTVKAVLRLAAPQTNASDIRARTIRIFYRESSGTYRAVDSPQAPNVAGEHSLSVTATIPVGATESFIRLMNGTTSGNGDVWWDDLLVTQGAYTGPYFDGSARFADGRTTAWTGTADASTSTMITPIPGMPTSAALYSITTPANAVPDRRTVLLIPEDMTLWLGYSGLATGSAVVRVQMISRDGAYGATTDLTLLSETGSVRLNSSFSGSKYSAVIIYTTQAVAGSSQLKLTSAKAVYETTGITPVLTGTHVPGLGHSGLRFATGPTFAYILYNEEGNRKYVSAAARFIEVGSWV